MGEGSTPRIFEAPQWSRFGFVWQKQGLVGRALHANQGPLVPGFLWIRLRSLTPGPPPFSSMNSMPAFSRAAFILSPVSVRPPNGPS